MNGFVNAPRQNKNPNALIFGKIISKTKNSHLFWIRHVSRLYSNFFFFFFDFLEPLIVLQMHSCKGKEIVQIFLRSFRRKSSQKIKTKNKFIRLSSRTLSPFLYLLVRMFYDYVLGSAVNDNAFFELIAIIQWPKKVMSFHMRRKKKHWILTIFIAISLASELRCDWQFKCGCQYVTCLLHEFLFAFASVFFSLSLFFTIELTAHQEHANQVKYL